MVDDCSKDDTWQKLQNFKQQHANKRIIIAQNKQNLGAGETRNRAFALSSGRYVCFWDADDYAYPQFVEKMLSKLRQEQADFVYCAHTALNNRGGVKIYPIADELLVAQNDTALVRQKVFYFHTAVWTKLVRRDFIQEYDIKFPTLILHEDDCWTMQLVLNAKKIAIINEPFYQYFSTNASSLSHHKEVKECTYWQLMQFNSDYLNKLGLTSLMFDEWNFYFLGYVLNKYSFLIPTARQDQFFLKVRDFCQQNNVALKEKELPFNHRFPLYLLVPSIGGLVKKRDKLKQAYSFSKKLLPLMNRLSALIKDAEFNIKEVQ